MFSIFYASKERTLNCTMTLWRKSLNWSIYMLHSLSTIVLTVLEKEMGRS